MSVEAIQQVYDLARVEEIAARLDLRKPNREAVESIAIEIGQHFDIDQLPPPFEAVVDSATGVGKTYILAGALDYLTAEGVRNFAIITPGRTILDKSVANFTPGHTKSLLPGLEARPVVITSDNFATAAMRAVMDDPDQVKLFVFTVQALLRPQTKLGRKTHKFQEGLGEAFYAHLQSLDDLVVFADEHHTYYGEAFSATVRELSPRVLIGLTATPHKKTPEDLIIYRYPLAAAIADRLVKTPVLVGRRDDRSDPRTKLLDGVRLLELKEQVITRWCVESGDKPIPPMMLVIAPKIEEANEIEAIVSDDSFAEGKYADKVLTVHSDARDDALAQLDGLEDPGSPYRIIVSVGMLKEGWDVKNVYVICSLRASVSDVLTEQTLGRGMRLPFGRYTGVEILDSLEVLAHERYEQLLKSAKVLNEKFIDTRTRAVLRTNALGQQVATVETTEVQSPLVVEPQSGEMGESVFGAATEGRPVIDSVEEYTDRAEQTLHMQTLLRPSGSGPKLRIPRLQMSVVKSSFTLREITDAEPFRKLGRDIAADPDGTMRRVTLSARIVSDPDGMRRTELVTAPAVDHVLAQLSLIPVAEQSDRLVTAILNSEIVPARAAELSKAEEIVEWFIQGLGDKAERTLSAYFDRAASSLIERLTIEARKYADKPKYSEVVELINFSPDRLGRLEISEDRFSQFRKGVGYQGFTKSLYPQDWFDSSTERDVANLLDDNAEIQLWARLQVGDLPILWLGAREYNPDFVVVETSGTHWLIEVKMDKEMTSAEVAGKREAAKRWASFVSNDPEVGVKWEYLLASEKDVKTAKGSWGALKAGGRA